MKHTLSILLLAGSLHISGKAGACDQCSCASAGTFSTISQFATYNFAVMRFSYAGVTDGLLPDESFSLYNAELGFGYGINRNLHISAILPIRYMSIVQEGETQTRSGFGDAALLANYIVLSNRDSMMAATKYTLSARGGVELPTGKFNKDFRSESLPAAFGTGSGSVDWMAGTRLILSKKSTAITIDYLAKYNMQNTIDYQFGWQQSGTLLCSRQIKKPKVMWLPYLGASAEWSASDTYHELDMINTKGAVVYGSVGLEVALNKWVLGVHGDIPAYADFDTEVDLHPRAALRCMYLWN